MYTIDMSSTKLALDELEKNPEDWEGFLKKFDNKKIFPEIKFGQALFSYPIFIMDLILIRQMRLDFL